MTINHIEDAKREIQAAFDLGEIPPSDTRERALFRTSFCLDVFYDEPDDEDDPGMALRDMLTDLVHYAEEYDIDLAAEFAGARSMASQEDAEWTERGR